MNDVPIPTGLRRTPQGIYVLESDSHLSRWIEDHKRLDIAEPQIAHYAKHIPVGGTVVDAGACLGDHACTYAKLVGPTGRVLAIEPNPLAFEALALNFERWKAVVPVCGALSDGVHGATLTVSPNAGASYITRTDSGAVSCFPLDRYVDSLMSCDLIHLDCEGWEMNALKGARAVIAKFRPAIALEINHECLERFGAQEADVLAVIADLGYQWQELEPGHGPHLAQRDILALPK